MATAAAFGRASSIEVLHADPARELGHDLYDKYAHNIYAFCFSRLAKREEAEDATQTTFLNAYRSLRRGVVPELELAWLLKIANHVILNRRRAASRRRRVETPQDLSVMQDVFSAHERDVDELIGIERVIASLPQRQRQAFLLREMQGLSYREVAEELELTQAAVETLLFRARRSLAEGLERPNALRRRLAGFDLGSILAPIKLFLTGGAGVKLVAATLAVATPVAIEAAASEPATSAPASAVSMLAAPADSGLVAPAFSARVDLGRRGIGARTGAVAGLPLNATSVLRVPVRGDERPAETSPAVVDAASSVPEQEPVSPSPAESGLPAAPPEVATIDHAGTTAAGPAAPFDELDSTVSTDAQAAAPDESAGAPPPAPTDGQGAAHQSERAAAVSGGANGQGSTQPAKAAPPAGANAQGPARQSDKAAAVSAGSAGRDAASPPVGEPPANSVAADRREADRGGAAGEAVALKAGAESAKEPAASDTVASTPAAGSGNREAAGGSPAGAETAPVVPEKSDKGSSASTPADNPAPAADPSKDANAAPNAAAAHADPVVPSEHAKAGEKTKTK